MPWRVEAEEPGDLAARIRDPDRGAVPVETAKSSLIVRFCFCAIADDVERREAKRKATQEMETTFIDVPLSFHSNVRQNSIAASPGC